MSDTEISNYLYNKSMEIEPRGCKKEDVKKVPRKWPNLILKSPGIKTKSSRQQITNTNSTMNQQMLKSEGTKAEDTSKSDDSSVFVMVCVAAVV